MAAIKDSDHRHTQWHEPRHPTETRTKRAFFTARVPAKISAPEWPLRIGKKPANKNRYLPVTLADKEKRQWELRAQALAQLAPRAHIRWRYSPPVFRDALSDSRRPSPQTNPVQPDAVLIGHPVAASAAEVIMAFNGWVDRVENGVATLRLEDQQGRRSVATYAVADLEQDSIPAQAGTAFRCQVVRQRGGFGISFQPVPQRKVSEARRKEREARTIVAYSTLQNDY